MAYENYRAGENDKKERQFKRVGEKLAAQLRQENHERVTIAAIELRLHYIQSLRNVINAAEIMLPGKTQKLTREKLDNLLVNLDTKVSEVRATLRKML